MTMVRSTFSIAVVSRFEDYKSVPGESTTRSRGYFETYKIRIRWIIRKAYEINYKSDDKEEHSMEALYRDEIVWLYNEVGLVSLVQGNPREAVTHLSLIHI